MNLVTWCDLKLFSVLSHSSPDGSNQAWRWSSCPSTDTQGGLFSLWLVPSSSVTFTLTGWETVKMIKTDPTTTHLSGIPTTVSPDLGGGPSSAVGSCGCQIITRVCKLSLQSDSFISHIHKFTDKDVDFFFFKANRWIVSWESGLDAGQVSSLYWCRETNTLTHTDNVESSVNWTVSGNLERTHANMGGTCLCTTTLEVVLRTATLNPPAPLFYTTDFTTDSSAPYFWDITKQPRWSTCNRSLNIWKTCSCKARKYSLQLLE